MLASTTNKPVDVYGSVINELETFDKDDASADDAFKYTLAISQNPITWLSDGRVLFAGTEGGVFSISSGTDDTPITPSNVFVKREANYGSNSIGPVRIGSFLYYIQHNTRNLRELSFFF